MLDQKGFFVELTELVSRYFGKLKIKRIPRISLNRFGDIFRWFIPNGGTVLLVLTLLMTQSLWARPFQSMMDASSGSATTVNYQGHLADTAGNPLTQQGVAIEVAIYDAAIEGNLVWPSSGAETHIVDVNKGLFNLGVGSKTDGGIPITTWNGDRYLEIAVEGETLSPRQLIRSVPVSGLALTVPDGAIGSRKMNPTVWYSNLSEDTSVGQCGVERTNVLEAQITNDFPATYLVWASVPTRVDDAGTAVEIILQTEDDTRLPGWIKNTHERPGIGGTQTGALVSFVDLPPGTHTIYLSACHSPGTTGYTRQSTAMGILLVSQ